MAVSNYRLYFHICSLCHYSRAIVHANKPCDSALSASRLNEQTRFDSHGCERKSEGIEIGLLAHGGASSNLGFFGIFFVLEEKRVKRPGEA
jgi:hypothetical protein